MNDKLTPIKIILAGIGCLLIFSLPVISILAIWNFEPSNILEGILLISNNPDNSDNYNFEIRAGEDTLLTSSIINEGQVVTITPRSNPAELIIIDSAQIEGEVVYGTEGEELLKQGFWHHPASVYPGEKGVSVIFGHRRYHLPPSKNTFYNLDQVNMGDRIEILLQDGTWLDYTIINIEIINPDSLHDVVNEETDEYLVKLITCHPLGTSLQRLVITAEKSF